MEEFIKKLPSEYFIEAKGEPDAYIIAMPKKEEKAKKIAKEVGLNTAGVRAVIGATVPRPDMELSQKRHKFGDKSRGCYLSHMKVYSEFLKTRKEVVLVMEEDAQLTNKKDFDNFMRVSKKMMSKDKPMISFAGLCWPRFGEEIGDTGMHKYKGGICTHGFLINRKAAKVLLNKPMDQPIDLQIAYAKEITKIVPNRFVLEQGWTKVTNERSSKSKFPPKKTLTISEKEMGESMFPKKVWTYWDKSSVPGGVEQCMNSWRHHLDHSWDIQVVDDKKLFSLVPVDYLPKNFSKLDPKKKSDSARVALVRKYGGVWSDAHVLMLEDYAWLEKLFNDEGATFVGYANPHYSNDKKSGKELVESWWFAALPESPVIVAWNKNWVNGVNESGSKKNFRRTRMYKETNFPDIEEGTKNYLYIAVALRHARDKDPGTRKEFEEGRAKVFLSNDGPSWHWDSKNHTKAKLDALENPRFFKFISLQHKHANQAVGNRDKMSSKFYRELFDEHAPKLAEKMTASGGVPNTVWYVLGAFAILVLFGIWFYKRGKD